MASRSAFPCRAVQSGASNKLIFVAFILFAFLPSGDSFLPGHLSAPSGGGRERCQRVRPTLPISLTSRGPRRLCGLFSLRGGGTAAEERAPLRDGEKKDNEKRLVPPGAVYGMGVGAITASRIAHVRPCPESLASRHVTPMMRQKGILRAST
ncbi:hypothetical protein T484DRAFT_3637054 [Baffinella frigidus]|nr:hypothetical protein T484DRAFT_3637054 [Cryptophyta sp. CCMP2293]